VELADVLETLRSLWLLWLLLLFGAVIWWAYRPKNRQRFEDDAQIPFREDNGE